MSEQQPVEHGEFHHAEPRHAEPRHAEPGGDLVSSGRLRRVRVKLEALLWMTRINFNTNPLILASAGWFAASSPPGLDRYLLLLAAVALGSGALGITNDLLDHEDDRVTAPYLPLPSGLLTRGEAKVACALLSTLGIACFAVLSGSLRTFLISMGVLALGTVAGFLYSLLKHTGALASGLMGVPWAVSAVLGWVLAGGGGPYIGLVVLYAFVVSFGNNILVALRDVELDPKVGNFTLPVRIGAKPAFRVAGALAFVACGLVAFLTLWAGRDLRALGILLAAAALLAYSFVPALRSFGAPGRQRDQIFEELMWFRRGETWRNISLVCALSLREGLLLGVGVELLLLLGKGPYARRLVGGELRAALPVPGREAT